MSVVRVYATVSDYQTNTLDTFTTAAKAGLLLRKASMDIDRATMSATYATDPQGYPADAGLLDAFMRATCEQAAFRRDLDDPTGAKARMSSIKVGSLAFTRAPGTAAMTFVPLGPDALAILQLAQALPGAPFTGW